MFDERKIHKSFDETRDLPSHLYNYDRSYADFNWETAKAAISGLPMGRGLNIAFEAVDRHVLNGQGAKTAIRWLGHNGQQLEFTYRDLYENSNRFANVLNNLGVQKGDSVFSLLGRIPELYFTALGTLKHRAVFCPLFSDFGPEPIQSRLFLGNAKLLVTSYSLFQRKVKSILKDLPQLKLILIVADDRTSAPEETLDFHYLMKSSSTEYEIQNTDEEDPALLHFTSGTTGKPKGAVHVHQSVLAHYWTGRFALDLHQEDIFWCTADPGWVTGTSYGIISPLTNGVTSIIDENDFNADRWYEILSEHKVSVWYTAPTAIRMAMKAGLDLARRRTFPHLRFIASVGEPLNPKAVTWGLEAFGLPIHDNWWQTETGGIMIANFPSMDIKPGSMGKPLPGITAAIVERTSAGLRIIEESGKEGELAIRVGWPSMFRGYLHEENRYKNCFVDDFYLTGDLARVDDEGYFWFVGRKDDIIKSSGHLIGPFEIESALMEHPAVTEAAAIGKPDPLAMETVKALVVLKTGVTANEDLRLEILGFARKKLGPAIAPKEIKFVEDLPKTRSGKIVRRLLRAREMGLPEGDKSALQESIS